MDGGGAMKLIGGAMKWMWGGRGGFEMDGRGL